MSTEMEEYLVEFEALFDLYRSESPRGGVLVLVSAIDNYLREIILNFLTDTKVSIALLDGFNAPLGSFSARISAAYSLGLIDMTYYKECHLMRKIRNEFAHKVNITFEDDVVKKLCRKIYYINVDVGATDKEGNYIASKNPIDNFRSSATLLTAMLALQAVIKPAARLTDKDLLD